MPISGPAVQILPTDGAKIADVTHADTVEHSMALPAGYPANTKAIIIRAARQAGTGSFRLYCPSGSFSYVLTSGGASSCGWWIRQADGLFHYSLSVANDDWDIYGSAVMTG